MKKIIQFSLITALIFVTNIAFGQSEIKCQVHAGTVNACTINCEVSGSKATGPTTLRDLGIFPDQKNLKVHPDVRKRLLAQTEDGPRPDSFDTNEALNQFNLDSTFLKDKTLKNKPLSVPLECLTCPRHPKPEQCMTETDLLILKSRGH